jgi:lanosterol synthase
MEESYSTESDMRLRASWKDDRPLKHPGIPTKIDRSRWRMHSDSGRHTWHYLDDDEAAKEWPLSLADKYYLNIPLVTLLASHPGPPD